MGKNGTSAKPTVELRPANVPSRIRRDPPPPPPKLKTINAYPTERETWTVVIGVILFAIALTLIVFGISEHTNN